MLRAISLGRLAGIRLDVHVSWFVIFALVTFTIAQAAPIGAFRGPQAYALAAVAAIALFASVIVHELGHALVARRFGVTTRSITLFLFGGIATLESEPPSPLADAAVAVAGPIVSALVAGATYLLMRAVDPASPLELLLAYVTVANAVLATFNLVPAYPMDGGRVLRALLWRLRNDRDGATATAALVGIFLGAGLALCGIVAAAATRTWQFGWYVVLAAFLLRQCWTQYRALRGTRPACGLAA